MMRVLEFNATLSFARENKIINAFIGYRIRKRYFQNHVARRLVQRYSILHIVYKKRLTTYLHPSGIRWAEASIEGHSLVHMWGQGGRQVKNRCPYGGALTCDAKVTAAGVALDEHGQVPRIHVPMEVSPVHLGQVRVALLRALRKNSWLL